MARHRKSDGAATHHHAEELQTSSNCKIDCERHHSAREQLTWQRIPVAPDCDEAIRREVVGQNRDRRQRQQHNVDDHNLAAGLEMVDANCCAHQPGAPLFDRRTVATRDEPADADSASDECDKERDVHHQHECWIAIRLVPELSSHSAASGSAVALNPLSPRRQSVSLFASVRTIRVRASSQAEQSAYRKLRRNNSIPAALETTVLAVDKRARQT